MNKNNEPDIFQQKADKIEKESKSQNQKTTTKKVADVPIPPPVVETDMGTSLQSGGGTTSTVSAVSKKETKKPPAPAKEYTNDELIRLLANKDERGVIMATKSRFLKKGVPEAVFEREAQYALMLIRSNQYLIQCLKNDKMAVVEAFGSVADLGLSLNPELKLAYLVPRKGKIYFQSSYMGKREVVMRTGAVKDVFAELVYENDEFDVIKGSEPRIYHKPDYFAEDRGKLRGGYWVCILNDGTTKFGVMPQQRIAEIQQRSEAVKAGKGSPWDTDLEEMQKKTIFNWGWKDMPKTGLSEEAIEKLTIEGKYEREEIQQQAELQKIQPDYFDEDEPAPGKKIKTIHIPPSGE